MVEKKYTLLQRIKVRLFGQVYLEDRTGPDWTGYLPFYLFRCKKHGLVEDYPHGRWDALRCPICMEEIC